ncbi:MAG TPA: hypothetical protein VFD70_27910 [Anaerolineae bacterium]|nr:hypothetical protein [Anaerolineae bacterium]
MNRRFKAWLQTHDTTMLLTIFLWLCALPFVLLLTVPFFGWQLGILASAIALLMTLAVCYALCYFPKIYVEDKSNVTRSRLR